MPQSDLLQRVDHLVYATPDLERTVDELDHFLGVRAAPGGRHQGRGTRNALIALPPASYLEIIGPDPAQGAMATPRWFGIDSLTAPRLVTWAAKATNLERLAEMAARAGVRLGPVTAGSRVGTDGEVLSWKFTDPTAVVADGLVPFFIDWGTTSHPSATAPGRPMLVGFRAEHPAPADVRSALSVLEIDLPVMEGRAPRLIATLITRRGERQLE